MSRPLPRALCLQIFPRPPKTPAHAWEFMIIRAFITFLSFHSHRIRGRLLRGAPKLSGPVGKGNVFDEGSGIPGFKRFRCNFISESWFFITPFLPSPRFKASSPQELQCSVSWFTFTMMKKHPLLYSNYLNEGKSNTLIKEKGRERETLSLFWGCKVAKKEGRILVQGLDIIE